MTQAIEALAASAATAKAWPFEEARKLLSRIGGTMPAKGHVLFETGYGPSGLPHIGTFGEVARTSMVRRAFSLLSFVPTRLVAFSDDLDGLRKVPDNVPNADMLAQHLGKPLTAIPDPFGTAPSYGDNMNARLCAFLDRFGFDYEYLSATALYRNGRFDATLKAMLAHYDAIMDVILPTLGPERRATYSPFLPICPRTGVVLQVPIVARDADAGTVSYRDDGGRLVEVAVTGGACKMQWKADWAMRWVALDVDYEMYGKDLIDSATLSGRIARILGARPPEGFFYELFLDEQGQKISKSKGNGLSIDEWLRYASPESLSYFMYQGPRKAKRLYFDVIPRQVDDYLAQRAKLASQSDAERMGNGAWFAMRADDAGETVPIGFAMLLNLASVCNTEDRTVLWGFISRYVPGATPAHHPMLDELVGYAIAYYRDFVKPAKFYRRPDAMERAALVDLDARLGVLAPDADAETMQTEVYEVGKRHAFSDLRAWFQALYEILLGQSQGPRIGSFFALYGLDETRALIQKALSAKD